MQILSYTFDAKNWVIVKDSDDGKDWKREEKRTTEGEMVGWHHRLDGHEFEQALGAADGQWSLECCSLWGCKESDRTELNWTPKNDYSGKLCVTYILIQLSKFNYGGKYHQETKGPCMPSCLGEGWQLFFEQSLWNLENQFEIRSGTRFPKNSKYCLSASH